MDDLISTVLIGVLSIFLIVILYNFFFYFFFEKILFQGVSLPLDHKFEFEKEFEEVNILVNSSTSLHALLFKSPSPKGLILYFHGNRGNLTRWGEIGLSFLKYNYDVMVMDYRGYGKSRGNRTEKELYDDARRFYDYAITDLGYDKIIIYGRSLGSAVATHLAQERTPYQLILETPMTQIKDIIKYFNFLLINQNWLQYKLDSLSRIEYINCPIFIFHGTLDRVVPYRLGVRLFNNIKREDKKLIKILLGRHNNLNSFATYQQAIKEILN
jgi:pimeloyl-ACP methyl ester carboxylesterase